MAKAVQLLEVSGQILTVDLDRVTGFRIALDYTDRPGEDGWIVHDLTGGASLTLTLESRDAITWEQP